MRDVVAPIKMIGEEIVINIPAAIGLTPSPNTACVLTDVSRAMTRVFHESMLQSFHCDLMAQRSGSPEKCPALYFNRSQLGLLE